MRNSVSKFKELGFLSDQMQESKASNQIQYVQDFAVIHELCKKSMAEIQELPNGEIHYGHLLGRSFWWRCMENCQGSIILIDLGMATSAMSTIRSAWENLFYACALWRDPTLVDKVYQKDKFELAKQIAQIQKYSWSELSDQSKSTLLSMLPVGNIKDTGLSVFEAAKNAELLDFYCISYRGLSLTGAHSTAVSAFRALPESERGGHDFIVGPEFKSTKPLLANIHMCLTTGGKRLIEFIESSIQNRI